MKWTIKIEGKSNQRIVVKFDPLAEKLIFFGQYKPQGVVWYDFVEIHRDYNDSPFQKVPHFELISAEEIQNTISRVYNELVRKVKIHEEFEEGFSLIKLIAEESDETEVK